METKGIKQQAKQSVEHLEVYVKNEVKLLQFNTAERLARMSSFLIAGFFASLLLFLVGAILSAALVMFLGKLLGSYTIALLIVGGIILLKALLIFTLRKSIFTNPLLRFYLKEILA